MANYRGVKLGGKVAIGSFNVTVIGARITDGTGGAAGDSNRSGVSMDSVRLPS